MTTILGRRSGRLAAGIAAALAVVMLFTVTPMGSVAQDFLDRFRVQKFAAITIEQDAFDEFAGGMMLRLATSDTDVLQSSMMDLGEFETTFNEEDPYANVQEFDSIDEAQAAYGDIRVPGGSVDGYSESPSIYLSEAGSATAEVNTAEVQAIIDELNMPIYSIPNASQYPTMTFQMDIPQAVVLDYEGSDSESHLVVAQMASPVLNTPEGLDMNALREDLLAVPGLPPDFVGQLRAIDDWQNTLVVPVPEGASSEDVTVDGEPGLLITMDDDSGAVVLWEDDGQLYVVAGSESGDTVLDLASSLD